MVNNNTVAPPSGTGRLLATIAPNDSEMLSMMCMSVSLRYFRFRRIRASDVSPMLNNRTVAPASGTGTVSAMINPNDTKMLNMMFISVSFAVNATAGDREDLNETWQG